MSFPNFFFLNHCPPPGDDDGDDMQPAMLKNLLVIYIYICKRVVLPKNETKSNFLLRTKKKKKIAEQNNILLLLQRMTVKMKWCKFQTVDNLERELHFEIYEYFGLNICPCWWWGRRQWCRWLDDIMRGVWRMREQQPVMLFMNLQVYLWKLSSLDTAVSTLFCWQLCLSLEGLLGIYGGHYVRFLW